MLDTNAIKQTNKWQLKGATYKEENAFYFVGDYMDNKFQLTFDVNDTIKRVVIPEPLKSLGTQADEIKNGIVHYNTKTFAVNHQTILAIDSSWSQTEETAICYCHMPYDALSNTFILCDKLNVVSAMITKTDDCGVKIINKVLAIRLNKALLDIQIGDNQEAYIAKFSAYFKNNPFVILYGLAQPVSLLLDDYSFEIKRVDNIITCLTHHKPSYFNIDYPVDVVINTTVDVKEVQVLAQEVRNAKTLIDAIKLDLDGKTVVIAEQYKKILVIEAQVNAQMAEIEIIRKEVSDAQLEVAGVLTQVEALAADVTTLAEEVRALAEQISGMIASHNTDNASHQDIRELISAIDFEFGEF